MPKEITKLLKIKMLDGSVFTMPNEYWQKAFGTKYSIEDLKAIKETFTKVTQQHWDKKTVPTKFSWDDSWHEDLRDEIYWGKLHDKYDEIECNEFKDKFGREWSSLIPKGHLDSNLEEKHITKLRNGIGLNMKDNTLIIERETPEAKFLDKIETRDRELLKKETDKEFEKQKESANTRFKTHAELGYEVMYQYIRAPLMGVIVSEMSKNKKKTPTVLALGNNKITEYNGKGKKEYRNIESALEKKR